MRVYNNEICDVIDNYRSIRERKPVLQQLQK